MGAPKAVLVVAAAAVCVAVGGCGLSGLFGDVEYSLDVTNGCDSTLTVDFGSDAGPNPYPSNPYSTGDVIAPGEEGTIFIMDQGDVSIEGQLSGGPWAQLTVLTHEELDAGDPVTIEGELCPPPADPHVVEGVSNRFALFDGATAATWTDRRIEWQESDESHERETYSLYAVLTGDVLWFRKIWQPVDDLVPAEVPALPDVVAAQLPEGEWVESAALGEELAGQRWDSVHVFVNLEAGAVLVTARAGAPVPDEYSDEVPPIP